MAERKTFEISHFKALEANEEAGTFEAIISTGHIDSYGDKVYPDAFTEDLEKAFAPVVWTHQWGTVPIGVTLDSYELEHEGMNALYGKGRLLVADDEDHDVARKVWAAMRAKDGKGQPALRQFSFAYDILDTRGWIKEDGVEHYALDKLHIIEWGPCLKGVNQATALLGVKADEDAQAGRDRPPRPSTSSKATPPPNPTDPVGEEAAASVRSKAAELLLAQPSH